MLYAVIVVSMLLASSEQDGAPQFDDFFFDRVLRVDLFQIGSGDSETVCLDALKEEPHFAGPRDRLIDPRNYGTHCFSLYDLETNQQIFYRGFCTLFGEWQTTREARQGTVRVFSHTLTMPFPRKDCVLSVCRRDSKGAFNEIFRKELRFEELTVRTDNPHPNLNSAKLIYHGDPHEKVDVVILGDGYTEEELDDYMDHARKTAEELMSESPFNENRERFNFWAVPSPSPESGVDEPLKGRYKATCFDTQFNTFGLARYSMAHNIKAIHDVAALAPHDLILIIFNSSRYGGGGIFNLYAMVSGSNGAEGVTAHEMGHHLGGLGDEYVDDSVAYIDFYPEGVEPWEPNVTALLEGQPLKWAALVDSGTPIPTPAGSAYDDRTGCFEGAGYKRNGLYRPRHDCIMRSCRNGFCPVCTGALQEAIDFYAD